MSVEGYAAFKRSRQLRIEALRIGFAQLQTEPAPKSRVLEIGCGHGHFLCAYAEAEPQNHYLGIDLRSRRIRKAAAKAEKRGLQNILFFKAELSECLQAFPKTLRFEQIFMLFPDPWPKKRHNKKRMLQADTLDALARHMHPAGHFYFRSDAAALTDWAREHFNTHPLWRLETEAPWPFEAPSYFQNFMQSWESLIARPTAKGLTASKPQIE